ncbi:uncharacterized protein LOC121415694 [Lytechinus variegatus]|uniref:uncharacterized protein LOC121415694 n=1 Tax=Lytechinus variegatus TaxID=7654 RepID=UPI001BB28EEE|nr:uncharacterized protein LOC121415694 [Lytechinus variegatus]
MMTYSFHEEDTEQNEIRGIAVAEESHNLYMASTNPPKITYINIDLVETGVHWDFAWLSDEPGSLEVDDELGFLYWSMKGNIQRKRLMPGGGFIQTIYNKSMNTDLLEITGLSIDLSRNPRRIFFCDFDQIFYKDVTSPFNTSEAVEIAGDMMNLREIRFFNGMLYWTKALEDKAIAVLKDYEHANRSFNTLQNTDGVTPFKFVIVKT